MVGLEELQAQVAASFARLPEPSWPNPRGWGDSPQEDEYSRVSDPGRYRVVHSRAHTWVQVLAEVPGVDVQALVPAALDPDGRLGQFDRGVRLTSSRPGTLPLLLLERDAVVTGQAEDTMAVLHVSVVTPPVAVAMVPDCGCDACDHGSDDLLREIDDAVGQVVGGPFVALEGTGWHARWHPGGGRAGGAGAGPDHLRMMQLCRRLADGETGVRLPRDAVAYVGRSWLS